jgi:hypothetical protein
MSLRSAILAATVAFAAIAAPAFAEPLQTIAARAQAAADADPAAQCTATTFRIYFRDGANLDATSQQMLTMAEQNMAQCSYAELHVAVNASSPHARQQGAAILAAADERTWNVARIEPTTLSGSPDYAEVTMTPNVMSAGTTTPVQAPVRGDVGV